MSKDGLGQIDLDSVDVDRVELHDLRLLAMLADDVVQLVAHL